MTELFGYIAAFCTTISFLPQAVKVIKTKDTQSLSLTMYSVFMLGILMWLVYGLLLMNWPMILANAFTITFAGIILFLKVKHTLQSKRLRSQQR
uniref:SemiSWEET transporter n=1 Tax=Ningiella ruwaisensis TaxID=2364274 RepID=UPI00109FA9D7|nr:SemiSWEET transporter [Ningiella ruwaisensis]